MKERRCTLTLSDGTFQIIFLRDDTLLLVISEGVSFRLQPRGGESLEDVLLEEAEVVLVV